MVNKYHRKTVLDKMYPSDVTNAQTDIRNKLEGNDPKTIEENYRKKKGKKSGRYS